MINRTTSQAQTGSLFETHELIKFLSQFDPLVILALAINWAVLESFIARFFDRDNGRPSLPLRRLIGLTMLKFIFNISDEQVVEQWKQNPYYQAFTGEQCFSVGSSPCHSSELSRFRARIGEEGCKKILAESVRVNGKDALEKEVIGDTTVQEKYTTFPTDVKLILNAINLCWRIAKYMSVKWRRSYIRETMKLRNESNFSKGKMSRPRKTKAIKRLRTIANILLRELQRKLPEDMLKDEEVKTFFANATKAVNQKKDDKNKIYSLFEPQICCIAKGKSHKKYEFGSKVSLVIGKTKGVILGALNLSGNPFDGDTIEPALSQLASIHNGYQPEKFIADRGYRGRPMVASVNIVTPYSQKKDLRQVEEKSIKESLRRRSSIEPIIGHVKQDHRMSRNLLKGEIGDKTNPILAASAFNFKKFVGNAIEALMMRFKSLVKKPKRPKVKLHGYPFRKKIESISLFSQPCPQ